MTRRMSRAIFPIPVVFLAPVLVQASEGGEGGGGNGIVSFVGMVVNFLILVYLVIKPLKKMLSDRLIEKHQQIRTTLEKAGREIDEAKIRLEKYKALLESLPKEIAALQTEARDEIARERERVTADLELSRRRIEEYTKELIDQEIRKAKSILLQEASHLIAARAEENLKRRIEAGGDRVIIASAIKELEAGE